VVSSPNPAAGTGVNIPLISNNPSRADLLVMVESKGKIAAPATALRSVKRDANAYHGRY
jgi:hypothetical protein